MERKEVIVKLNNLRNYYSIRQGGEENSQALDFAISSLLTDEAYQLEYERTTKNDLGVDCVSRKAVLDAIDTKAWEFCDYLISQGRNDEQNPVSQFADNLRECVREELPSVTPQEPKTGHWILTDVEGNRVWHCHCSECGKDPQDYVSGSENWWLIKSKLPKFCSNCGAKMVEPQESEDKE